MKLQLALDDVTLSEGKRLVESVQDYIDIVEVGSPMIIEYGMTAVRELHQQFPQLEILADTKIMDAGNFEAAQTFKAGARYCTVLGVTDTRTVVGCLEAAEEYGQDVFVDMICVPDIPTRVKELEAAGVTCLGVHTGVDQQAAGRTPLEDLQLMKTASNNSTISVAGGINASTVTDFIANGADIVIVGSGLTHADYPVEEAKKIYDAMRNTK